ncbi:LysE family translocator [Pelagibaculum spongiae]|uniref:Lysine transporter LysE n=1 Tax=Pelagibaculum spongiae TaxID=2080658 RepID=A0A2V1H0M5_9GAMM|nr:LysE family translocator [Pelagibaculum spongiae]PVZ69623.1 lysine transporter LysE [Pelagibaculum spongiae]
MSIEVWISFIAASMVLCFSPGPTVFLVMGKALEHGKKSVTPLVAGTLSGDVIAMSFSFVGMGALLATSATLFNILKWAGALYLLYLGIKAFCTKATAAHIELKQMEKSSVYFNSLLVTALNPKGIIFFMAFFPLFINANSPVLSQMIIMAVSFLVVSTLSVTFYATFSGILRNKVSSVKFQNGFNKVSGGMLVGAGAITATIQNKG